MQKLYEKYNGYLINDIWGCNSRDFDKFASYAKRRIKAAVAEKNITLISFDVGHYDISGFLQSNVTGKYAYFSLDHCRWEPLNFDACDDRHGFLLRTANGPKDFTGGQNHYVNLKGFLPLLEELVS